MTIKKFYTKYRHVQGEYSKDKNIHIPPEIKKCIETSIVFTPEQEEALIKCIQNMEYLFYGILEKECRMLAYQMVVNEDLKIPVDWNHGMASIAWLMYFKEKYSTFMNNLDKPDRVCTKAKGQRHRTAPERNTLMEKKKINTFYDDLEKNIHKHSELLENKRIFSLDETYMHTTDKTVLVDRENKYDFVTICCIICADGTSLPPVIVRPYSDYGGSEVSGSAEFRASRGRLTPNLFIEVIQHFVKHSHTTPSNPSILIMDTDLCHFSSAALNMANDSGVQVLTIHTHANSLLQPLQGVIFELFHECYYEGLNTNSSLDISKIVREAYAKTMTPEIILNAFKRCGINPFDRDLFTDSDYESLLAKMEDTCVECRLRGGRSRINVWEDPVEAKDNCGELHDTQIEMPGGEEDATGQIPETVKQKTPPGGEW